MSVGTPAAGDVPSIFDLFLNGYGGYIFLRANETQRASYGFTPTFLERTNVGSGYGDDQQDFFLTVSQNNWADGEQQRFAHISNPDTLSRSWQLANVDATVPGRVTLRRASSSAAAAAAVTAMAADSRFFTGNYFATATNAYFTTNGGSTFVDQGAHGLGVAPSCMAGDGGAEFLSSTGGGTVGVRKLLGGVYSTFSATAADSLCYLNNSLYGVVNSTGTLNVYSTAGVATSLFQWKTASGTGRDITPAGICAFGPKLALYEGCNVWTYDGSAVTQLAALPTNFYPTSMVSTLGLLFIGGYEQRYSTDVRPAVYVVANGEPAKLWDAQTWSTTSTVGNTAMAVFDGGVIWNDDTTNRILSWTPGTGAVSGLMSYSGGSPTSTQLAACPSHIIFHRNSTTVYYFPLTTTVTSGTVTSSLYDFDNSLTKQMRGIKVDFDSATDGDGGSIDIAYRVNDVDGSYTALTTGAVSGTEYLLTGVSGRSISVKLTLNKGTSTLGPVLKRDYVRAAPTEQAYKRRVFFLDLSGRNGNAHVVLNNGADHPLDGYAQAVNLNAAIGAAPFAITDRFGSFTGIIEPGATELIEIRPEEYAARVTVREV